LRAVAAGTAGVVGEAFLRSLAHHVAEAFDAEIAFVAEGVGADPGRVRVIASWHRGAARFPEGTEYDLAGTVCSEMLEQDVVAVPQGVGPNLPPGTVIVGEYLEAYLAIAMRGRPDPVSALQIARAQAFKADPPPADWDGLVVMETK